MPKKKSEELATVEPGELAPLSPEQEQAALAQLSEYFDGMDEDGMGDVEGDDIRLPSFIWNMSGVDKDTGDAYKRNEFYNTLSGETFPTFEAVMLCTTKSNRYDYYDNDKKKTIVVCQSADRETGTIMETNEAEGRYAGTQRPCNSCPDFGYFREQDMQGKERNVLRCGRVHTVVGIERLTQKPFILRHKKTGLKAWRNHLMAHHFGARINGAGKRKNIPLFAFYVKYSLKMHENGNYAVVNIDKLGLVPQSEVMSYYEAAKSYKDMMDQVMQTADRLEESAPSSDGGADNLSSDDFQD